MNEQQIQVLAKQRQAKSSQAQRRKRQPAKKQSSTIMLTGDDKSFKTPEVVVIQNQLRKRPPGLNIQK